MRGIIAMVVAAALAGILALTASGAEPQSRPLAGAALLEGTQGTDGTVEARGTVERRYTGDARSGAGTVEDGVLLARGSATRGTAAATAQAGAVSLLAGRVVAAGVRRSARATVEGATYEGEVEGLTVDGTAVGDVTGPRTIPLADGTGRIEVNTGAAALRLVLTADTDALPKGTDVRVAAVQARVKAPRAVPTPTPTPTATRTPAATPDEPEEEREEPKATPTPRPKANDKTPKVARKPAPKVPRRLTRNGFTFPVFGKVSFDDTFGAPRQAAVGGSHLGNDVFADFGSPVVAVADGTVSHVGTLEISGNRLWLETDDGDAFFYAHLSAFSPTAVDGRRVKAGTVLGFVGNTGDAEPTPPHLHFEIHPDGLEEDAVDPYPILLAWQGRRDVPAGAWLEAHGPDTTERPGALVAVRDFIAE